MTITLPLYLTRAGGVLKIALAVLAAASRTDTASSHGAAGQEPTASANLRTAEQVRDPFRKV